MPWNKQFVLQLPWQLGCDSHDRLYSSYIGKYNKTLSPQPVNDEGILWLGIIAVSINGYSNSSRVKTKNESILSLHFLGRYSGLGGCHSNGYCPPIYRLVHIWINSYLYAISFFILSKPFHVLEYAQDFHAVPEG